MESLTMYAISYILKVIEFYDPVSLSFSHPPIGIVYLNFDYEPILPETQENSPWALAFRELAC